MQLVQLYLLGLCTVSHHAQHSGSQKFTLVLGGFQVVWTGQVENVKQLAALQTRYSHILGLSFVIPFIGTEI